MKVKHIFVYGFLLGGVCFLIGFVGPIIFMPDANQGPLLGIFITGPLGFILGIILGIVFYLICERNPEFKYPFRKIIERF